MPTHRKALWLNWLTRRHDRSRPGRVGGHRRARRLAAEPLERRAKLAADFAAITGIVTVDTNGPNEAIPGVVMQLHLDNGDGVFDPVTDSLVGSTSTAADGHYRFDTLAAGGYFVHQQDPQFHSITLPARTSPLITISPVDAEGTMHTVIDSFDVTQQIAKATSSSPYAASTAFASEAIGGFRKLLVTLDQPHGTVAVTANDPDSGLARLDFAATATATGSRRVTWDGTGSAADATNYSGLGGIDLTHGGMNTGIVAAINADKAGAITVRMYSDAGNASTAVIPFPDTLGSLSQVYVPFSSLLPTSGAGADLTNLGAIQIDVDAASAAADGFLSVFGAVGPTVKLANFTNEVIDLELTKTVDVDRPQIDEQVTFTITVSNQGSMDATGVQVLDLLPTGLNFVGATATQGSYDATSGLWNVGTVAEGASQTLTLVATVTSPGLKTNTAQVFAADQVDIDSIPGNSDPTEDDQASATVLPKLIDLGLTKIVDTPTPFLNELVTFTVTVENSGPDTATGVTVVDVLPTGLVYYTSTPSVGTYDSTTGLWAVGTLANGQSETLLISAAVTTPGTKVNTAQVHSANEHDIDSMPGNDDPTEDDQASASVTPVIPPIAPVDPPPPPPPVLPIDPPAPLPSPLPGRFSKLRFLAR